MGDSLCDMFLKEHEKHFPVHAMMQAFAAKPKTPYQLDLEVKDRKSSIVPKVGDRVKIKSREWYEKWKNPYGNVDVAYTFVEGMSMFCGRILEVELITRYGFNLKGVGYSWSLEMFEEVYPVQAQLGSGFPKIDLNSPSLFQSPYDVNGGELVLSKEEQERLKEQLRTKWGVKPKLKQIKTTHLIKLKKL